MLILQKAEKEASDKEKQNAEENGRCFYCKCAYQTKERIFCVRCGRKNKTVRGGLEWKEVVNYLKESHGRVPADSLFHQFDINIPWCGKD